MAVTLIDGFDLYAGVAANVGALVKWTQFNVAGTPHTLVSGRFGDQALRSTRTGSGTTGGSMQRPFPGNYASFSVGVAVKISSFSKAADVRPDISFLDTAPTHQCGIRINTSGAIEVYRYTSESAGTLLGTSAAVISLSTWYYIECEVTIDDAAGVFNVYVDGAQVLNLTSQDTKGTANAYASYIRLSSATASGYGCSVDFDDLYITDSATKLGLLRVQTLRPAADTAEKDFTRSAGSDNYALVDDTTCDGDTSYVQGSTVGDLDRYTLGDFSAVPTSISAVQVTAFGMKTDAGGREINLHVKSGATTSDGSNYVLAASYSKHERILETDPDTVAAWTGAAVDALEIGLKVAV